MADGSSSGPHGPGERELKKRRLSIEDGGKLLVGSLLAVGDDALHVITSFLPSRDLFRSEMICKTFKRCAGLVLDGLMKDMNGTCDRMSDGESDRTKLIRYLAASEMARHVREGLSEHLAKILCRPYRAAECRGCKSFPQMIDKSIFYDDEEQHEFYLYFFDKGAQAVKFDGFVPFLSKLEFERNAPSDAPQKCFSFRFDLHAHLSDTKWAEMKEFLEMEWDAESWGNKVDKIVRGLSIILAAVNKSSNMASLVGAAHDFSDHFLVDEDFISSDPHEGVYCDVHSSVNKDNHPAYSAIAVNWKRVGSKTGMEIEVLFWGDDTHVGVR